MFVVQLFIPPLNQIHFTFKGSRRHFLLKKVARSLPKIYLNFVFIWDDRKKGIRYWVTDIELEKGNLYKNFSSWKKIILIAYFYFSHNNTWELVNTLTNKTLLSTQITEESLYPFGSRSWTNVESNLVLNLTLDACNETHYNCRNGLCIDRSLR